MNKILEQIVSKKRHEIELLKSLKTIRSFEKEASFNRNCISLSENLLQTNFGIIAEFKRKSPSAGEINSAINISEQSLLYQKSGASAVSILTDNAFFGGSIEDIHQARKTLTIPILRKEFIIDELQIFEAKASGADAILLIAEILTKKELLHFTILAKSLGLEVLAEFHSFKELEKLNKEVDVIGINNRNLDTQTTSVENSYKLAEFLPKNKLLISESGIKTSEEIQKLISLGYKGALIGESILKDKNPAELIKQFNTKSYVY
ncbi:MAG: indole-3-glycerol phosphate synthase TrpC [Bacteroidota bacterium]